jgi:predicted kinase
MFAAQHFKSHCVLSSDKFRLMLFDDTSKQNSSELIFDMMKDTLEKRLRFGTNYTVINSTNLKFAECADYLALASKFKRKVKFISFDPPASDVLVARYKQRCLETGASEEVIDIEKQCLRYHSLMPRFIEVAKDDPQAVDIVRINQDWEIIA